MQKVLVLGVSGMLGSAVYQTLLSSSVEVLGTSRVSKNNFAFNASTDSIEEVINSHKTFAAAMKSHETHSEITI